MGKTKLLTLLVVVLALLNIGILGYLYFGKQNNPIGPRDGQMGMSNPKNIVVNKLKFDENQQTQYQELIEIHQSKIKELDDKIRTTKTFLYSLLSESNINTNSKDSLILALNQYQKQIEQTHFNHFVEIKKICRPEQIPDYNTLTEELSQIFAPHKPPRPRHD